MIRIVKTDADNPDFMNLVKSLDAYLKITDGNEHDFYNQFNAVDRLNYIVVAYLNEEPVACGAFKPFEDSGVEIKRMFTKTKARNKGIAALLLKNLENWAKTLEYKYAILETGKRQIEAVKFYKKCSYVVIPNYGQYQNMGNSICFKKELI